MKSIEYVGFVAGTIGVCFFIPEIVKSYKAKAVHVSYFSIMITLISSILWIVYHYYKDNISGLITTFLYFGVMIIHLIQKMYYQYVNKKMDSDKVPIVTMTDV